MEYNRNTLPECVSIHAVRTAYDVTLAQDPPVGDAHGFPEVLCLHSGQCVLLVDGARLNMHAGEMVVYAPGAYHIAEKAAQAGAYVISFDCDEAVLAPLYNRVIRLDLAQQGALAAIVEQATSLLESMPEGSALHGMTKRADAPDYALQQLKIKLELFLIDLLNGDGGNELKTQQFEQACSYLRANIAGSLTLENVAGYMHMGISTLTALFRHACGKGVIARFNEMKIDEAKRLMGECGMNCCETAERLGFSSLHYFSRLFKRVAGMPPSAYAKEKKR